MDVTDVLLILRNTGHKAELARFAGDSYKVDGHNLTRRQFEHAADRLTPPTHLF